MGKMKTARFKAVLFDIDGTLLPLDPIYTAVRKACKKLDLQILSKNYIRKKLIGYKVQDAFPKLFRREPDKKKYLFRDVFHDEYSKLKIRALPGVIDVLRKLKKMGVKVGIVTTKARIVAEPSLRNAGIHYRIHYDVLLASDDVKKPKPNPAQIIKAMKRLKLNSKETLVVGDHVFDIMAGIKAGCMTAGVGTGVGPLPALRRAGADWTLKKIKEVLGIVKAVK